MSERCFIYMLCEVSGFRLMSREIRDRTSLRASVLAAREPEDGAWCRHDRSGGQLRDGAASQAAACLTVFPASRVTGREEVSRLRSGCDWFLTEEDFGF